MVTPSLIAALSLSACAAQTQTRDAAQLPAAVAQDLAWLVRDIGPRPAGSAQEAQAIAGITDRLHDAGWTTSFLGCPTCLLACRGSGSSGSGSSGSGSSGSGSSGSGSSGSGSSGSDPTGTQRLFLAHPDTVPGSPGAVDNAAGVVALLQLARTTTLAEVGPGDLCLAFPGGEELGLVGSTAMARAWPGPLPRLVVALDLTGQGRLSVTGLGPAWSGSSLGWLGDQIDVDSPFAYRVVSRILPGMERSDHRPFAQRGVLSMHLLGRGPGGVFSAYHQPTDTQVQPQAMVDLQTALHALATAPLPPPSLLDNGPDPAVRLGPLLLPAGGVWLVIVLGALSGLADLLRPCEGRPVLGALTGLAMSLWRGLLGAALAAGVLALSTLTGIFASTPAEATAAAVMGTAPTGWWTGVLPGLVCAWVAWWGLRRIVGTRGSAPLAAALLSGLALTVDPLLALPFSAAALLSRLHPLLAALPAVYLLWPDKLRELAFHGLLPPAAWGALWLLAWPAFGAYARPRHAKMPPRASPGRVPTLETE